MSLNNLSSPNTSSVRPKKILGVIPARYASSRLPGKPLVDILGKPMIQHVYERAQLARSLSGLGNGVIIATDDERIFDAVLAFGGIAVMTSPDHPNGTSRVEEVARNTDADIVINIQGDEPLLNPRMIDEVAEAMDEPDVCFATLCRPLADDERDNPNAVKVVMDQNGDALYFSRSLIPYARKKMQIPYWHHIGIYGYTTAFLKKYVELPMTPLAEAELLEQLKAIEHGYKIRVKVTECPDRGRGVDTPEDLEYVRRVLSESSN